MVAAQFSSNVNFHFPILSLSLHSRKMDTCRYIYIYPVLSSIHHKIHYNAMRKNNANNKELKNFLFVLC